MIDLVELATMLLMGLFPPTMLIGHKKGGYYWRHNGKYASNFDALVAHVFSVLFSASVLKPMLSEFINRIFATFPESKGAIVLMLLGILYIRISELR